MRKRGLGKLPSSTYSTGEPHERPYFAHQGHRRAVEGARADHQAGEYIAAGLSIQVTVGAPNEGDQPTLNIGLCNNLDQILGALKSGLEQARNERTLMAKSELKELQAFFDKEGS